MSLRFLRNCRSVLLERWRRRCVRSSLVQPKEDVRSATQCQELLHGWDQEAVRHANVVVGGAGGLGSEIGLDLVQAGVGRVVITDRDRVELSNLHRQLFRAGDIGSPKVNALARNVTQFGASGSTVFPRDQYLQDYLEALSEPPSAVVVGVDNDEARLEAAKYCLKTGTPLVNVGLSENGAGLQVQVQEANGPCLRCMTGEGELRDAPCGGLPVDRSLCAIAGGLATRAVFSVLMPRPRTWNSLTMFPDIGVVLSEFKGRRADCSVCAS